jgi:hypothetical protein
MGRGNNLQWHILKCVKVFIHHKKQPEILLYQTITVALFSIKKKGGEGVEFELKCVHGL